MNNNANPGGHGLPPEEAQRLARSAGWIQEYLRRQGEHADSLPERPEPGAPPEREETPEHEKPPDLHVRLIEQLRSSRSRARAAEARINLAEASRVRRRVLRVQRQQLQQRQRQQQLQQRQPQQHQQQQRQRQQRQQQPYWDRRRQQRHEPSSNVTRAGAPSVLNPAAPGFVSNSASQEPPSHLPQLPQPAPYIHAAMNHSYTGQVQAPWNNAQLQREPPVPAPPVVRPPGRVPSSFEEEQSIRPDFTQNVPLTTQPPPPSLPHPQFNFAQLPQVSQLSPESQRGATFDPQLQFQQQQFNPTQQLQPPQQIPQPQYQYDIAQQLQPFPQAFQGPQEQQLPMHEAQFLPQQESLYQPQQSLQNPLQSNLPLNLPQSEATNNPVLFGTTVWHDRPQTSYYQCPYTGVIRQDVDLSYNNYQPNQPILPPGEQPSNNQSIIEQSPAEQSANHGTTTPECFYEFDPSPRLGPQDIAELDKLETAKLSGLEASPGQAQETPPAEPPLVAAATPPETRYPLPRRRREEIVAALETQVQARPDIRLLVDLERITATGLRPPARAHSNSDRTTTPHPLIRLPLHTGDRASRVRQRPGSWPWSISDPQLWSEMVGLEDYEVPEVLVNNWKEVDVKSPAEYTLAVRKRTEVILDSATVLAVDRATAWIQTHFGRTEILVPDVPQIKIGTITEEGKFVFSNESLEKKEISEEDLKKGAEHVTDTTQMALMRRDGSIHCVFTFLAGHDYQAALHRGLSSVDNLYKRQCREKVLIKIVYGVVTNGKWFWLLRKCPEVDFMLTPNSYGPFDWNFKKDRPLIFSFMCMMMRECLHLTRKDNPTYLPVAHPAPLGEDYTPAAIMGRMHIALKSPSPSPAPAPENVPTNTQVQPTPGPISTQAPPSAPFTVGSSVYTPADNVFSDRPAPLGVTRDNTPSVFALDPGRPREDDRDDK